MKGKKGTGFMIHLHVIRDQIPEEQTDKEKERLFSKGQACMRSSRASASLYFCSNTIQGRRETPNV